MQKGYTTLDTYRYERKFVTPLGRLAVEGLVKQNSTFFVSAFQPRRVNNIYFDTPGLDCYFDNLFGNGERWKARIRWYNSIFGKVSHPVLEFKMKKGLVGTKESFRLPEFLISKNDFDASRMISYFSQAELPIDVKHKISALKPVLLNSYTRSYFATLNNRYRITVDDNLDYYNLRTTWNTFDYKFREHNKTVLELKYDKEWDTEAGDISSQFPFRLDKNSKFIAGMGHFRNEIPV